MLILEKTATTTTQRTPFLEYENVLIENLGANNVTVMHQFLDLKAQMVDDGAVVDVVKAYSFSNYVGLKPKVKKSWFWGLYKEEIHQFGYLTFKTESGTSEIKITAYNGSIAKSGSVPRLYSGGDHFEELANGDLSTETVVVTIEGAGECEYVTVICGAAVNSQLLTVRVYCDDNKAFEEQFLRLSDLGCVASTPTVSLTQYAVNGVCAMIITAKFSYQTSLKITIDAFGATAQSVIINGFVNKTYSE